MVSKEKISEQLEKLSVILESEEKRKSEDQEKICRFIVSKLRRDTAFSKSELTDKTIYDLLNSVENMCINNVENFIMERDFGEIRKMLMDSDFRKQVKQYYKYIEPPKKLDMEKLKDNTNKFTRSIKKIFSVYKNGKT